MCVKLSESCARFKHDLWRRRVIVVELEHRVEKVAPLISTMLNELRTAINATMPGQLSAFQEARALSQLLIDKEEKVEQDEKDIAALLLPALLDNFAPISPTKLSAGTNDVTSVTSPTVSYRSTPTKASFKLPSTSPSAKSTTAESEKSTTAVVVLIPTAEDLVVVSGSSAVAISNKPKTTLPKPKFIWTDDTITLFQNLVKMQQEILHLRQEIDKANLVPLEKRIEEQTGINTFLKQEVVSLWPKQWITCADLLKKTKPTKVGQAKNTAARLASNVTASG